MMQRFALFVDVPADAAVAIRGGLIAHKQISAHFSVNSQRLRKRSKRSPDCCRALST